MTNAFVGGGVCGVWGDLLWLLLAPRLLDIPIETVKNRWSLGGKTPLETIARLSVP